MINSFCDYHFRELLNFLPGICCTFRDQLFQFAGYFNNTILFHVFLSVDFPLVLKSATLLH